MVKTKFTRNGREVMIFGAMRNFDYGSDEAIQESKKGGERDASVSLSSPERSRIRKSVEWISMLASTEASKASKTRRRTSYGSPASSPEKTTRRGTSYGIKETVFVNLLQSPLAQWQKPLPLNPSSRVQPVGNTYF
uniref:Uncharacterized protein n=1 Tax=Brassica oleracea TaxID=3712 RepID=A0A3P6EY05_BRAOL|nr:unnamed protein product [Brassica oleracea]